MNSLCCPLLLKLAFYSTAPFICTSSAWFSRKSTPGRLHVLAGRQRWGTHMHTHAHMCTGTALPGSTHREGSKEGRKECFYSSRSSIANLALPSYLSYAECSCQGSIQMKGFKHDTESSTPLPFQSNYWIHLSTRRMEERGPGSRKSLWQLPVHLMGPNFRSNSKPALGARQHHGWPYLPTWVTDPEGSQCHAHSLGQLMMRFSFIE